MRILTHPLPTPRSIPLWRRVARAGFRPASGAGAVVSAAGAGERPVRAPRDGRRRAARGLLRPGGPADRRSPALSPRPAAGLPPPSRSAARPLGTAAPLPGPLPQAAPLARPAAALAWTAAALLLPRHAEPLRSRRGRSAGRDGAGRRRHSRQRADRPGSAAAARQFVAQLLRQQVPLVRPGLGHLPRLRRPAPSVPVK